MSRLFRRTLDASAVLSALLGLAMCALWSRSYWHYDDATFASAHGSYSVTSGDGLLLLELVSGAPIRRERGWSFWSTKLAFHSGESYDIRLKHFGTLDERFPSPGRSGALLTRVRRCWLPHWSVVLASLVLPTVAAVRKRRGRRRAELGLCRACGYDLRATPERGGALLDRCPECGAVSKAAPKAVPTSAPPAKENT